MSQAPRTLKGFRDTSGRLEHTRKIIEGWVRKEAELGGYINLDTPALEYEETLLGQAGAESDKQVYRFVDHGGRNVAMRFDLTLPFARFVAQNQSQILLPFKKFQMGKVWRGENPQKGRYREFVQCDFDIVGTLSLQSDLDILICLGRALDKNILGTSTMRIGSRPLLCDLIEQSRLENVNEALIVLDKLDKVGPEKVEQMLLKLPGASPERVSELLKLVSEGPRSENLASKLSPKGSHALSSHLELLSRMEELKPFTYVTVKSDLSIARGLGYYTGMVFETTLDALPGFGSVCSGGRYDNLVSRFSKKNVPGVGGSIGLDRLVSAMEAMEVLEKTPAPLVFIAVFDPSMMRYAHALEVDLRQNGISAELTMENKKIGAQMGYADKKGCRFVAVIGLEEVKNKMVTLKDLSEGNQQTYPRDRAIEVLQQFSAPQSPQPEEPLKA